MAILEVKSWIRFEQGDGLDVIRDNADRPDVSFFVDPPYTVAGRRLYTHNQINHSDLFEILAGVSGDFLMTYDDAAEIRNLAHRHGLDTRLVPMKSTHHAEMTELIIGRDLSWLRVPDKNDGAAAVSDPQTSLD